MLRAPADSITIAPAARATGRVEVPGDKSISHRYAMVDSYGAFWIATGA